MDGGGNCCGGGPRAPKEFVGGPDGPPNGDWAGPRGPRAPPPGGPRAPPPGGPRAPPPGGIKPNGPLLGGPPLVGG